MLGAGKGKGKADATKAAGKSTSTRATRPPTRQPLAGASAEQAEQGVTHKITLRSSRTVEVPDFVDKPRTKRVPPPAPLPRPQLLSHLSVGINEVTRALETRIRWGRWELGDPSAAPGGGAVAAAAAAASGPSEPAPAGKRRRTHSKHCTVLPPLEPLHPVADETLQRPSYRFLFHSLPKPTTRLPSYLLPPTDNNPFFRVLANEHHFKLRKLKEKDTKMRASQSVVRKRDVQFALLGDVIKADHDRLEKTAFVQALADGSGAKKIVQDVKNPAQPEVGAKGAQDASTVLSRTSELRVAVTVNEVTPGALTEPVANKAVDEPDWVSMIDIIFVCKPDINPPSLVEHLPNMVGAANAVMEATTNALDSAALPSASTMDVDPTSDDLEGASSCLRPAQHGVYLVQLDLGAELRLGDVLALRRVAALGLSVCPLTRHAHAS